MRSVAKLVNAGPASSETCLLISQRVVNCCFSISSNMLVRTLLGIEKSWIPPQLWQSPKSHFLGSFTIWPVFQSVLISSISQMS